MLTATTPALIRDPEVAALLGDAAMLDAALRFEIALADAAAACGAAPAEAAATVRERLHGFQPDRGAIVAAMPVDGVAIPELMRQIKARVGPGGAAALHLGATSQDVVDTALVMALAAINDRLGQRLAAVEAALAALSARFGARPLMGRTRMQAALPITVSDRIAAWAAPLARHRQRLGELRPRLECVQYGGAVGVRGPQGEAIAGDLAARLGLHPAPQWHSARDGIVEYGGWLSLVSGSLGKIGQDVALMAQQGLEAVRLSGGGTSSAMPHKQNPVAAEMLVTLARFNAGSVGTLHQALVHEQERSGAAWTLEWLTLPPMIHATAHGLTLARDMLSGIMDMGEGRPDPAG